VRSAAFRRAPSGRDSAGLAVVVQPAPPR